MDERKRLPVRVLAKRKAEGKNIVMASVYDHLTAQWVEQSGVDIVALGDHAVAAFKAYGAKVYRGMIPDEEHSCVMKTEEQETLEKFLQGE